MRTKAIVWASVVLAAHSACPGQSALRLVAMDGNTAPGFFATNLDVGIPDQSVVNSAPQLLADGQTMFRAALRSTSGGFNSSDGWWLTREGSHQVAAYNATGITGPEFLPTSQFARMYAAISDRRALMDRLNTLYIWRNQHWEAEVGSGAQQQLVDGTPWTLSSVDRSSLLMPSPQALVFGARVPIPAGSTQAGPGFGFVAGADGVYTTLLSTGQAVPGLPGVVFNYNGGDVQDQQIGSVVRMNPSGQWVGRIGLFGTGVNSTNDYAICHGSIGGAPQVLLRQGSPAPGWPQAQGATVNALSRPSINASGHIVFIARTQTLSPSSNNSFSLYLDRGDGLELIARTGDALTALPGSPAGPSATINSPLPGNSTAALPPVIGNDGTVGFYVTSSSGNIAAAWVNGVLHQASRSGYVVPRTSGRVVMGPVFASGSDAPAATGIGVTPEGDVLFSALASGFFDPRLTSVPTGKPVLFSWRPGRGVRMVVSRGQVLGLLPSMRSPIWASYALADGNTSDGVPTGYGQAGHVALLLDASPSGTSSLPTSQMIAVADLNVFACGLADIAGAGAEPTPDGALDNNDFIVMIDRFFGGDLRADYGKVGGAVGFDDRLDNNDFVAFIALFFAGC